MSGRNGDATYGRARWTSRGYGLVTPRPSPWSRTEDTHLFMAYAETVKEDHYGPLTVLFEFVLNKFMHLQRGTRRTTVELQTRFHYIRRYCEKFATCYNWVEMNRTFIDTHEERIEYAWKIMEMSDSTFPESYYENFPWVECWEIYCSLE